MNHAHRKIGILVLLSLMAGLLLLAFPTPTAALPQYATATGQPCSTCHVNPAGGGTLTATGQAFAAIPTHSTDPAGAFAQVSRPAAATATPAAAAPTATPTARPATAATPAPTAAAAATTTALPKTGEPDLPIGLLALLGAIVLVVGIGLQRLNKALR